jgi:hypothetical protein
MLGMTASSIPFYKSRARVRAFNFINSKYLVGKTKVPAWHIAKLNEIEIDLVIANLVGSSLTGTVMNESDWPEVFKKRAIEHLENLRWDASVEPPTADASNTGNGTVIITPNDNYTITEKWVLTAVSATQFYAVGEVTGPLPEITVGQQYPANWKYEQPENYAEAGLAYEEFPFSIMITAGSTPFIRYDRFTFRTFSSSYYGERNISGHITRG